MVSGKGDPRCSSVRDPLEGLRLYLALSNHNCTIEPDDRWQRMDPARGPEDVTSKGDQQAESEYRCAGWVFSQRTEWRCTNDNPTIL